MRRISIVTPSYNQGPYLEATIRSVIWQEGADFEYIVLDGGSSDDSREIIGRYEKHLAFWRSAPDRGQAAAIREGFELARGEVFMWLNADDILLPGALAHISARFSALSEPDLLVGGSLRIDGGGSVLRKTIPVRPKFESLLVWGAGFSQPACAWRGESYRRVGGINPDLHFCMDRELFLRLLHYGRCESTRRLIAGFRVHPAAKSQRIRHIQANELAKIRASWSKEEPAPPACRLIRTQCILTARILGVLSRITPIHRDTVLWIRALHHSAAKPEER